jgi:hypothetical protein
MCSSSKQQMASSIVLAFCLCPVKASWLHTSIVASSSSSPSSSSFFPSWMDLCQMICHPAERTQPNPTKCIHPLSIIHLETHYDSVVVVVSSIYNTTQFSTFHNFSPRVYNHGFQKKLILSSNQGSQKLALITSQITDGPFEVFGRTKKLIIPSF